MAPNLGGTEKIVRYVLAIIFLYLAFFSGAASVWKVVFGLVGVILAVTAYKSFCPIWSALHINTRGKSS